MSSIFDSAVYALQKSAPYATPQALVFLADKAMLQEGAAVLRVTYNHRMASRLWWVLEWHEAGQRHEVSAQKGSLCLWRAIQLHKNIQRRLQLEQQPVTRGPGAFSPAAAGWSDGDGI